MVLFVPTSKHRGRGRAAWLQVVQGLLASKPAKIRITKRPSPEPVQPSACRSCSDYQLAFFPPKGLQELPRDWTFPPASGTTKVCPVSTHLGRCRSF